jgi:hypothetical protein
MIIDSSKLVMIGLRLVVIMEPFSISTNRARGHHRALAGGTSTSRLTEPYSNPLGHHQALAGGTSTAQLTEPYTNPPGHHQALAGGTSTSQLRRTFRVDKVLCT